MLAEAVTICYIYSGYGNILFTARSYNCLRRTKWNGESTGRFAARSRC